jgi:hypothetical protein
MSVSQSDLSNNGGYSGNDVSSHRGKSSYSNIDYEMHSNKSNYDDAG